MKLQDESGNTYSTKRVKRPTFRCHRGRTWDAFTKHLNGYPTDFHLDTTWGTRFYFTYQDRWYSASVDELESVRRLITVEA